MSTTKKALLTTVFKLRPGQEIILGRVEQHEVGYSFELDDDGHPLVLVQFSVEAKAQ